MRNFNLSRWALEHQPLTRFLLVVLLLGGIFSYGKLGQDEDPPFTFRAMVVRAYLPGASANQVAEQLTDKLEKKLQETPYINKIRSYSKPGETLIILQLKDSSPPKEINGVWYQVRKKITDIQGTLPAGTIGPFFNDEFGDVYGSIYALSADGFNYEELREYADFMRQELLRVPSVSKIDLFGVQAEKIYIEFSHKKLAQLGLDVNSLITQINQQNSIEASGVVVTPTDNVQVRISGEYKSLKELENLVLRASVPSGAGSFRLGDIATVKRGLVEPQTDKMRFQGKEVIGLGISMEKGGDIIALGRNLKHSVDSLKTKLPVGIEIEQVQDQPKAVQASVGEFVRTLIEAVVIVLVVSFLSLGLHTKPLRLDIWPGLVVALTIPLVLAATFLFMYLFDIGLHKISLGALIIALGLLVDDAIIAVEMMVRKLEEGMSKIDAASFAYTSTAMPMLTGTLITAVAFTPVGFAKSVAGEYTFAIFGVTAIALVLSWFAAVIFTPYLGYLLLKVKKTSGSQHHDVFDTPLFKRFRALVNWCVEWRKSVILITVAALFLGVFSFKFIEQQFFPDSNRPELMVEIWLPEGSSIKQTEAEVKKFEALFKVNPKISSITSFVGTGAPRFYLPLDQIFPQSNVAQLIVLPENLAAREGVRQQIIQAFKVDFPQVRGRVKFLPNGPPVPYPVQFRVSGPQIAVTRGIADEVKSIMRANSNAIGVNDNWNESIKVLRLDIDQEKARLLGVSSQSLARATQTILTGSPIGTYRDHDKKIDIVLRQPLNERSTLDAIAQANIPTNSGKSVPISQIATVKFVWEPGVIWRENREAAITVQCDVVDGIQGATVTAQIVPKLEELRKKLPPGYRITVAGATEESANAGDAIVALVPMMLAGVLILLMLQLHSFSRTVLVFLTGPLGFVGAALALLVLQRPFGFVAQLGVIALLGMIIRNSVILVDQIEHDIAQGVPAWNAIVEAAVRRARPILLTAAAAVLAMIPLSRSVFWGPMAVAIMGGLIIATLLTLLFLPALYAAWFRVKKTMNTLETENNKTRWERRKTDRPHEILQAALSMFVAKGFAATRLEDVAQAAGVSKGTVYLYFSSKEELFKSVVSENIIPLISQARELVSHFEGSSVELLRTILYRWWQEMGDSPIAGIGKLVMSEAQNFPEVAQFYHQEVVDKFDQIVQSAIRRGVDAGEFKSMHLETAQQLLCAPMIYLMMWQHSFGPCAHTQIEPKRYIDQFLELYCFGIVKS